MECWAHAAARRRRIAILEASSLISRSSSVSSSSGRRKSSSATSASLISSVGLETPPLNDMIRRSLPQGRMPHVCVVGAGMAGLRAADVLMSKGIRVTILEGRDRIGGRIHQSAHLGHLADLGPNWIHGTEGNPILDLAKETNTTYFEPPTDVPTWLYDEDGAFVDSQTSQEQTGKVWETIEEAYKYSRDNAGSIPSDRSLLDFFKMRFREQNFDQAATKQMLQIARVWGDVVGEPIERQSLKFFWLEECLEGENVFLAGTYKAILDAVAKPVLAKVDLHLNTIVRSITALTNPDGGDLPSVTLTTTDNKTHTFDEVILTTPLGWLKKNLHAFSPPLPQRIATAIAHISYGRLEKVYITFPTAWWLTPNRPAPFFTQFLSPTYSTATNPEKWSIECTSLAALPAPHAHPTLLFYINGPCAQHVTSLIHNSPLSQHLQPLSSFFHPYFSLLPYYSPHTPQCTPTAILATNWIADDLAGNGSYSTFQTSPLPFPSCDDDPDGGGAVVELDKDIEALREGVPEKGVWFAGEAVAPFVALGTVTGAWWSGGAVAARVLKGYGLGGDGEGKREGEEVEEEEEGIKGEGVRGMVN